MNKYSSDILTCFLFQIPYAYLNNSDNNSNNTDNNNQFCYH